ncbi:MAG: hypothetical protein ACI81L_003556, partial [Verrucomicrobiales bacterium]
MRRHILPLLFALFALLATACGSTSAVIADGANPIPASDSLADRLHAAQDRWEATELTDYVVTWSPSCFCPSVTFSDTIVSGEVVSHEVDG